MISIGKTYVTGDGTPARVHEIVGDVAMGFVDPIPGMELPWPFWANIYTGGFINHDGTAVNLELNPHMKLVEIKKTRTIERWLVLWSDGDATTYLHRPTESELNGWAAEENPAVFAVKHLLIEVEEGEGLEN